MNKSIAILLLSLSILTYGIPVFAEGEPVPHIFDWPHNPILANEFNENFQELSNRNDTTQNQVTQNESDISTNQSSISVIEGTVAQIQNDITSLQTNTGSPLLQFVGNSTGMIDGQSGIRTMTELCQADYPGSRVCTTEEYAKTTSFPAAIPSTNQAWIMPSILVGNGAGISDPFSGQSASTSPDLNCSGWTGGFGTVVNGDGEFNKVHCDNPTFFVSCCK